MEGVDVGADAMLPILRDAKIPLFGFVPYGPQQRSATDIAVFLGTAVPAYGAAELKNSADQGRKKLRLFLADLPSSHSYDESVLQPTAKTLGLDVKIIYYDAASADWNALATTAMADNPDESGSPSAQEADCLGFIQGLRGAGFTGPIFAAACNQFIATVGAQAVGVQTYSEWWLPSVPDAAPPAAQAELKAYEDQMTASGNKDKIDGFAGFTFAAAVNFGLAMQKYLQGEPTGENILTALHAVKDMPEPARQPHLRRVGVEGRDVVHRGRPHLRGRRRRWSQARLQGLHRRQRLRPAEVRAAHGAGRTTVSQYILFLFVGLGVGSIYASLAMGLVVTGRALG